MSEKEKGKAPARKPGSRCLIWGQKPICQTVNFEFHAPSGIEATCFLTPPASRNSYFVQTTLKLEINVVIELLISRMRVGPRCWICFSIGLPSNTENCPARENHVAYVFETQSSICICPYF